MTREAANSMPIVLIATECSELRQLSSTVVQNYRLEQVADLAGVESWLTRHRPALALLDLELSGQCMLRFCEAHPDLLSNIPVVFRAANDRRDFRRSLDAVRAGACDVIQGSINASEVERLVNLHLNSHPPSAQPANSSRYPVLHPPRRLKLLESRSETGGRMAALQRYLYGTSPAIQDIRRVIAEVALMKATVLIHGESGTGKEMVASAIHRFSNRSEGAFVPVNMSAIPAGLAESTLFGHEKGSFTSASGAQVGWCEAADGGTLFLDEIGEMELPLQPKLLRFLQESTIQRVGSSVQRKVDVRVVAATNRDLGELVKERRMREDLYFRLHVVPIYLPPLRERPEDIEELAMLFLSRCCEKYERDLSGFSPEAMSVLQAYSWPGNVRQLENMVERTVIFAGGDWIEVEQLPPEVHAGAALTIGWQSRLHSGGQTAETNGFHSTTRGNHNGSAAVLSPIQRHERLAILDALNRVDGHVVDAARLLGLGQATVYRKIKQYNIPHQRTRRVAK